MTYADVIGVLPVMIVAAAAVIVMLIIAFYRSHFVVAIISAVMIIFSFLSLRSAAWLTPLQVTPLLIIDQYALFFMGLILAAAFVVLLLGYRYLRETEEIREEFYIVLLVATLGAMVLAASSHFASFFLGLELLTVSLYAMIAYLRQRERSLEAGVKYIILAGASSAFLLFGMALLYGEMGTMEFSKMAPLLTTQMDINHPIIVTGIALMVVGIGFKLAVVPFHAWTPDIYEGAPAPVTAFIATVSKGAMLALLLRFFITIGGYRFPPVVALFGIIAAASMFVGNFLALFQLNVKRILAYSSIAHLGYMLVAFVAGGLPAMEAIFYYLVVYFITTLTAFGVVTVLSSGTNERDALSDYTGLFWTRPWLGGIFTASLLSLAGIPLTAGFIGKYLVVAAGVGVAQWTLVIILVINSAIGLYYYLRIVVAMLARPTRAEAEVKPLSGLSGIVLILLGIAIIYLGVYPAPLLSLIHEAVAVFRL